MVQPGVQVDPAALDRVAGDVDVLREDHDRTTGTVTRVAEEVGRRLPGWELSKNSEDRAFAWRDDAKQASGWLEDYAAALRRCAQDYRHLDQVTAEAFNLFPQVE